MTKKKGNDLRPKVFNGIKGGYFAEIGCIIGLLPIHDIVPQGPFELQWMQLSFLGCARFGHYFYKRARRVVEMVVLGGVMRVVKTDACGIKKWRNLGSAKVCVGATRMRQNLRDFIKWGCRGWQFCIDGKCCVSGGWGLQL